MFKLPKSFTDPTLHVLSIEDFFNPLKNEWHVTDTKYLTHAETTFFWKSLFTRENMLNNWELFFPVEAHMSLEKTDIEVLLSKFQDEDLWKFAFLNIGHLNNNKPAWVLSTPRMVDYSLSSRRFIYNFHRAIILSNYSYRGDNFGPELLTLVQPAVNAWEEFASGYPNYVFDSDYITSGTPLLLSYMGNYVRNRQIYHHSDETPTTLHSLMDVNPSTILRVTFGYNHFKATIKNPVTKTNKSALYRMLSYSADVLDLLSWPILAKGEKKPMLYGVELEVSTAYDVQELIEASDEPFFACKQDSSITGSFRNKPELVTVPMSLKAHKEQWSHLFSNLDYEKFDTTIETNNGMHVHIGRTAFSDLHLRTFAWFFANPSNKDFIVALSERKENQMHQYSALPSFGNRTRTTSLTQVISKFDQLRGAVNLHKSKPTVEVRIFKGIASYATILKNLEAVDAIFHFTQQCSQTSAGLREFLNFLRKTPRNKYPVLKEFVLTLDTKKMLSAAQLNDLLFNVSDPKKIMTLIERKKFPITSHHVSILNAKQGVRTFIFNKETGTMEIIRSKQGKMSHLDRILEGKYTRNKTLPPPTPVPEVTQVHDELYIEASSTIASDTLNRMMEDMADPNRRRFAVPRLDLQHAAPSGITWVTDEPAPEAPYPWPTAPSPVINW